MDTAEHSDTSNVDTTVATTVDTTGDATISTSIVGIVNAEGSADVKQSGAFAVLSQGDMHVSQSGSAALIANSVSSENVGSGVVLARDVSIAHGWVGLVASPKVELSENSRVIVGPIAALIIAAAIFGVFGIAVVLAAGIARRAAHWRPRIPIPSVNWRHPGE